jgi:TPR repeat protein
MMHFIDVDDINDARRATYYLTNAYNGGCPDASALLSYLNKEEVDTAVSFKRVFDWHMDNQDSKLVKITLNIGWMYYKGLGTEQDYTKALYYFDISAGQNDICAQRLLGIFYENGHGIDQDWTKAREWYTKAANQSDAAANYNLGYIYHYGEGVEVNYQLAFKHYQIAADQGHADAQVGLGSLYQDGHGTDQNWTKAIEWYIKSVNQNNTYASYNLGIIYQYGNGVEVNYQLALQHYQTAADQGCPDAQTQLAVMYHRGLGVEKNSRQAIQLCSSIPNKDGDVWAFFGSICHSADTQFQDFPKAIKCYERTEGMNNSYSLRGLGLLYEHGDGVEKDYKKAYEYYLLSQGEGNKGACYNIALLYYYGKGVCQDFFASFESFKRVLENDFEERSSYVLVENDTESDSLTDQEKKKYSFVSERIIHGKAHFYLGIMNEKGQGTSKDHEKALYHFKSSHSLGIDRAKKFLEIQ